MNRFAALLFVPLVIACSKPANSAVASGTASTPASREPAAKIGSRALSTAELDTGLKSEIEALKARSEAAEQQVKQQLEDIKNQVREQEYTLRRKALANMVMDLEAQSRGLTRDALIAQEITAKAAVTAADTDALWEEVKARAQGAKKEQVLAQLNQMAGQRKTESRTAAFERDLFRKYNVTLVGLQPSRKTVAIPANAPVLGPRDAPITIVEFTDYQCPFCQQAQQYVDRVMKAYEGKVKLVYQEFPLDFHGQAKPAGKAARCAGEQGKFWEMHQGMLRSPGALDDNDLKKRAQTLGLDASQFSTCVASNKFDDVIQKAIENGRSVGVSGTPTFFLNGRSFSGALPYEMFERIIEEELLFAGSGAGSK